MAGRATFAGIWIQHHVYILGMNLDPISEVRGVRLPGETDPTTLHLARGRIVAIGGDHPVGGGRIIDAAGGLAMPGLVESHLHLDKAFLDERLPAARSLAEAIAITAAYKAQVTTEDMTARATRAIERAVLRGTTLIRAETDVDPIIGLRGIEVMLELRDRYADLVDLQIVAFPQEGILRSPGTAELLRDALDLGADVLGACCYNEADLGDALAHLDLVFELAAERGVDLDLHADFADTPADPRFGLAREIARRAAGLPTRVTIGHATAIAGADPGERAATAVELADTGVAVVTLPMTDLHLGGRAEGAPTGRGITAVEDLWAAGVEVACSTNNVRNAFTPYGDVDLLETGLLLAQLTQRSAAEELDPVLDALTATAASVVGVADGYGLSPGDRADLWIVDADDPRDALLRHPPRKWVLKAGRLVARSTADSAIASPAIVG
jgi:cytosine/creatinine deaminase